MMDTSALVAALVADHEHHALARPHLRADGSLPAIVLAATGAVSQQAPRLDHGGPDAGLRAAPRRTSREGRGDGPVPGPGHALTARGHRTAVEPQRLRRAVRQLARLARATDEREAAAV